MSKYRVMAPFILHIKSYSPTVVLYCTYNVVTHSPHKELYPLLQSYPFRCRVIPFTVGHNVNLQNYIFLQYFLYLFTIQLIFLPYFPNLITIQLTLIPYFPHHLTIQLTFLPYFHYFFTI